MRKLLSWTAGISSLAASFINPDLSSSTVAAEEVPCCASVCDETPSCEPVKFDCGTCATSCCIPWYAHRNGAFGEFLYLAPGNSDIVYAREQTGPAGPAVANPTGPLGIVNIDEQPGFRAGFNIALDLCTSLFASYTHWEGESSQTINATGINILQPVLLHPSTLTAGSTGLQSTATEWMDFNLVDVGLRRLYRSGPSHAINWTAGLRYGNINQNLLTTQTISVATGLTNFSTEINFDGVGLLAGFDAERQNQNNGLLVYGKAVGSMLGGNWYADSRQTNQFGGGVVASDYSDFRLTPVLEAEIGTGWQSAKGRARLTTGFLASGWFNAISTRDYIQSFNEANLVDMNDTISFSGFVAKIELRR